MSAKTGNFLSVVLYWIHIQAILTLALFDVIPDPDPDSTNTIIITPLIGIFFSYLVSVGQDSLCIDARL